MSAAAEEARALMKSARVATLATVSADGAPLATLVAVTGDGQGRPLFLLSGLAEHTRNLKANPHASLLVSGEHSASMDRPRVSFSGKLEWLQGDEAAAAKQRFTQTHEEAKTWVTLSDFEPARLQLTSIRFVAGFGRAVTISAADYERAP